MTMAYAADIATWRYAAPYDCYDMADSDPAFLARYLQRPGTARDSSSRLSPGRHFLGLDEWPGLRDLD
jgi:hypothetical protein